MTAKQRVPGVLEALAFATNPAERAGVLERAIAAAEAEEREACAAVADRYINDIQGDGSRRSGRFTAAAVGYDIRARGSP